MLAGARCFFSFLLEGFSTLKSRVLVGLILLNFIVVLLSRVTSRRWKAFLCSEQSWIYVICRGTGYKCYVLAPDPTTRTLKAIQVMEPPCTAREGISIETLDRRLYLLGGSMLLMLMMKYIVMMLLKIPGAKQLPCQQLDNPTSLVLLVFCSVISFANVVYHSIWLLVS